MALCAPPPGLAADQRLRASDRFRGDQFGVTLATDGRTLVVGAPDATWNSNDWGDGAVYVFERGERGRWEQRDQLVFPICCWAFGGGVAISGGRLLVGAPKAECTQFPEEPCGRAFYYERRASGGWEQIAELNSDQMDGNDHYGTAVAVAASSAREVMAVGAPSSRRVLVYERQLPGGEISEVAHLQRNNLEFGRSLALGHDLLAVGAASGKVYLYRRFDTWTPVGELTVPDGFDARFGHAVAMDGGLLAAGAPSDAEGGPGAGAVYLFARGPAGEGPVGEGFEQVAKLLPDRQGGQLGWSVALRGDRLLAGAPFDDTKARNSGAVYLFAADTAGGWDRVGKLIPSLGVAGQELGRSAAVAPEALFAGAPGVRDPFGGGDVGSAFVFENHPLAVAGYCPGEVLIRAAGLGPLGRAALLVAREPGRSELDSEPCAGTPLDLRDPVVLDLLVADEDGVGSLRREFAEPECGVFLQAVDEDGCATSNLARVSVKVEIPETKIEDEGYFGDAVAVDGDLAVAAPVESGVVVYERDPSDPTVWSELVRLAPADGTSADDAVDISGGSLVAGAWDDDWCGEPLSYCGSAYVYRQDPSDPTHWTEVRLELADAGERDQLGRAVAISGDTVVLGAKFRPTGGAALVFERDPLDPDVWALAAELQASDGEGGDEFGSSVALRGDLLAVGAEGDRDHGSYTGSAYVFERDPMAPGGWRESGKLTASDGAEFDFFGRVAIAGETVAVGAWSDEDLGDSSGSVYVFERDPATPGVWVETAKLLAPDGGADDRFGYSIAAVANRILVGAYHLSSGVGAAYLYERDPIDSRSWSEILKLTPSDGELGDAFGYTVDLDPQSAIVGAPDPGSGAAYIYSLAQLPDPGGPAPSGD